MKLRFAVEIYSHRARPRSPLNPYFYGKNRHMAEREQHFMQLAIDLSREGMRKGSGGPFGCLVVKGNDIIGRGHNRVTEMMDPTAHAEIVAIRDACRQLGHFQLTGCEIFTSCEPCPMCLGAIYWARPLRVYFANTCADAADAGFDDSFIYNEVMVSAEHRSIKMTPLGRPEALKVFEEWKQNPDRLLY